MRRFPVLESTLPRINFPLNFFRKVNGFIKIVIGLSRKTNNNIGANHHVCNLVSIFTKSEIVFLGVPAIHAIEYVVATGLNGRWTYRSIFLVASDLVNKFIVEIPRVAGNKSNDVNSGDFGYGLQ